jgi:transcriptional regulator with XRE-family HTH domain
MDGLYERIQTLCKAKGVTGSRMCLDLGISKSTLSDIKCGRKKGISTDNAQKIASYLGVTVGYLLGEEETKKSPVEPMLNEGEKMLLDLFRQIPEDRQQVVIAMIKAALDRG